MYFSQQLGSVVRELRERRMAGASITDLLNYLKGVVPNDRMGAIRYLNLAFCQGARLTNLLFPFDGELDSDLAAHVEIFIDEKRSEWESQPFPMLHRTRDYFSFLQLAVDHRLIIFVCGAQPHEIGYRLHGAYGERGEPAWSAKRGEQLRSAMNRRLGGELIRWGPHDDWEFRNSREVAGALYGPQLPVIEFSYEHTIRNYLTVEALARYSICKLHWARLYPHHPVTR
jgi:hypothetical protein